MKCTKWIVGCAAVAGINVAAFADTLSDIKTNVVNNANAIQDMSCVCDISYQGATSGWGNYTAANFKRKGVKFLVQGTGTDVRETRTNGVYFWNINCGDPSSNTWSVTDYQLVQADSEDHFQAMTDFASLISGNTWTLDGASYTVSGVSCHRITSTNYDMYVDTATKTKVMKVTRNAGSPSENVVFSGYSFVESTAYVPSGTVHTMNTTVTSMTCSSISINDNLADSLFVVE